MNEHIVFVVMDCEKRKPVLVCSSARKAAAALSKGKRIEAWSGDVCVERIYDQKRSGLKKYIERERVYIAQKQAHAQQRNAQRKALIRC